MSLLDILFSELYLIKKKGNEEVGAESPWPNVSHARLWPRCKQIRTPVTLLCSLSNSWERYELPYCPAIC